MKYYQIIKVVFPVGMPKPKYQYFCIDSTMLYSYSLVNTKPNDRLEVKGPWELKENMLILVEPNTIFEVKEVLVSELHILRTDLLTEK